MTDKTKKLSSKEKKEWLDYLDWKIENEKSMQTWSGISVWILVGLIGFFGDRILSLISIYGLDDLLSLNSLYLVMCFLLVSFAIFDISKITISANIRPLNEQGGIIFVGLLEFILYFIFSVYLIRRFGLNVFILRFTLISILFATRLYFSPENRQDNIKKVKKYKRRLKLRINSPTTSLIAGIILYLFTALLVFKILDFVKINHYTTFNNGADLLGFSAYLYLSFISLLALFSLLFRKYTVKRLVTYRDKLFFEKVKTEKIKEYITDTFHGVDFEEYANKEMKQYDEKIEEIKSKLSSLEEKTIGGKLKPNEMLENYIHTKELWQKQHDLVLKNIKLSDRKYIEPFSFAKNKELRNHGLSLCDDAIGIEKKIKELDKQIKQTKTTLN